MAFAELLGICLAAGLGQGLPVAVSQPPLLETYGDPYLGQFSVTKLPGRIVRRGGFTSVQVNVDGAGNNIVGDAANEPSIAVNPLHPNNMVAATRWSRSRAGR